MLKNNIIAALIHIFASFIFFVVGVSSTSSAKWASEEAARNHNSQVFMVSIILVLVSFILYYYIGKKILVKQKNVLYDFCSVSSVLLIGIILWIISYSSGPVNYSNSWMYYFTYNSHSILIIDSLKISNVYILIVPSFVPSLFMTLGLSQKK